MRILVIGLSRELPLGPADAMELADHLVKRAAAVQADGNTPAPCPSQKREVAPSQLSHALAVLSSCHQRARVWSVPSLACHTLTHHLEPPTPVSLPTSRCPRRGLGQTREPRCLWVSDVEVLKVERIQLIDAVLNLCTYHHPENIQLPPG